MSSYEGETPEEQVEGGDTQQESQPQPSSGTYLMTAHSRDFGTASVIGKVIASTGKEVLRGQPIELTADEVEGLRASGAVLSEVSDS